jgi:ADP-ribose pyrophosphatase YjhB (NUDIX family)
MAALDPPLGRPRRLAARVVVIAPDGSTFLFRYDDVEIGRHWSPPGGGLEPGETFPEAARRELIEETGWSDLEPQDLLHIWEQDYTRSGTPITQYEQLYLAFGPKRAPLGDLRESHAADEILEYRWWTPSELRSTHELIWPPTLSELTSNARG